MCEECNPDRACLHAYETEVGHEDLHVDGAGVSREDAPVHVSVSKKDDGGGGMDVPCEKDAYVEENVGSSWED